MADLLPFPVALLDDSNQPPDAAARHQALDTRSSFIVEAPAGSGKTGLLIQRYLKLLADESVTSPEQVLAITFTNKATAELRSRVLTHLEAAQLEANETSVNQYDEPITETNTFDAQTRLLANAVLARDRKLSWSLLDHPHRLHIRTIDSVCAEIARTLPVLSGSGGRLNPATDAGPLHHEAARRTLLQLGQGDIAFDDALRNLLIHRDGNLADCEALLARMLSLRDQWGKLIPLTQPQLDDAWLNANLLPRLEAALDYAVCVTLTQLERVFPPDLLAELTELAAEFGHRDGYDGNPSPVALCAQLRHSPQAVSTHLEHWRALSHLLLTADGNWRQERGINGRILKFKYDRKHQLHFRLIAILDQLSGHDDLRTILCEVRALPPAKYPADQWAVAKSLFRVLSRALVELQLVFAERGECDFTQLSLLARHALEQESGADDLANALGARLQHLLVDEMQDTSTSQYTLIERLTASWDGHSQTVFLVGDPRQSIYLFRQARVERFIHAMHTRQLGDLPLIRLRLTANFRSQRTLVDRFNHDFGLIFPDSASARSNPAALPYTPADPTLPSSSGRAVWHAHILPASDPNLSPAEIRLRQSRSDADEILRIARPWLKMTLPHGRIKPWSIAVLVRGRNHLTEIVAALRQQHDPIPFRAVEIETLDERQEILDLTALTRAVLHPADRVAALAALYAPWCGLRLADLHTLTGADDSTLKQHSIPRLMAERGHLLPDDSRQRMTRIWTILQAGVAKRTSLSTAQLVERAWLSLGGDAWLTPPQLANARRFFQLLDELETSGTRIDPALLTERLHTLYAEPQPIPAGTSFIELLTIHKAKGLEWDVVFVPALEKSVASNRSHLLTWSEIDTPDASGALETGVPDAAHIMLAPIPGRGEESKALNTWLNSIQRSRDAAECKRLFYVACTRAREELHLFATPQRNASGVCRPAADSLLKAAWAAAEPHFAASTAQATPASASSASAAARSDGDLTSETRIQNLEPSTPNSSLESGPLAIAAAAAVPSGPILERLPSTFDPAARFTASLTHKLPYGDLIGDQGPSQAQFARPEGSFAARSFGNAVHACLDILAVRIHNGESPAALLTELPSWHQRIATILRSDGLPRTMVERLASNAHAAIANTLRDPSGLWLLAPHLRSSSEFAITAWPQASTHTTGPASIRVDRIFEAGPEPCIPGEEFLWIIDYKTTAPGPTSLDDFLSAQRAAYGPQLETYARILAPARAKSPAQIRLALYFPVIPRLFWWQPIEDAPGS